MRSGWERAAPSCVMVLGGQHACTHSHDMTAKLAYNACCQALCPLTHTHGEEGVGDRGKLLQWNEAFV